MSFGDHVVKVFPAPVAEANAVLSQPIVLLAAATLSVWCFSPKRFGDVGVEHSLGVY